MKYVYIIFCEEISSGKLEIYGCYSSNAKGCEALRKARSNVEFNSSLAGYRYDLKINRVF
jgi:hypothetical protein